MKTTDIDSKIASLDAFLSAQTDDPDAALEKLKDDTSPDGIRRRLVILLDKKDYKKADQLLSEVGIDNDWAEPAIRALVFANKVELAINSTETLINKAGYAGRESKHLISILGDSLLVHHRVSNSEDNPYRSEFAIGSEAREQFSRASSMFKTCIETNRIANSFAKQVDQDILQIYCLIQGLLGNGESIRDLVALFPNFNSVHMLVGKYMIHGALPVDPSCSKLLIDSNPNEIPVYFFARALISKSDTEFRDAWLENASELISSELEVPTGSTIDKVMQFAGGMLSTYSDLNELDLPIYQQCIEFLESSDNLDGQTLYAGHLIERGRYDLALKVLQENRNEKSPNWHRSIGECLRELDREGDWLEHFKKAGELSLDNRLLKEAAQLHYDCENPDAAAELLSVALNYYPSDISAIKNLAWIQVERKRFDMSIQAYEALSNLRSLSAEEETDLAGFYFWSGEKDPAKRLLVNLVTSSEVPQRALFLYSEILCAEGQASAALEMLDAERHRIWDSPEQVSAYMQVAHQAGDDEKAHEAFKHLAQLKEEGRLPAGLLEASSLDQLKEHMRSWREQEQAILQQLLAGRMPWVFLSDFRGVAPYWEWRLRTQELDELPEYPITRANYCVYATNSFAIDYAETPKGRLSRISAPPGNSDICIDLSALITMNELRILNQVSASFSKIYISGALAEEHLSDSKKLQPHQQSRVDSIEAITSKLTAERIGIDKNDGTDRRLLSEYSEESEEVLRFASLLSDLVEADAIPREELNRLTQVTRKRDTNRIRPIHAGEELVVELESLRTLANIGVLDKITSRYSVYLTEEDFKNLQSERRAFDELERTYKAHERLWSTLRVMKNVTFVHTVSNPDDRRGGARRALTSFELASQRSVPLVTDDRALQAVMTTECKSSDGVAFGTDLILARLHAEQRIGDNEYLSHMLSLFEMRYRFILPSSDLLRIASRSSVQRFPTKELKVISKYIQDCMLDPGLSATQEQADPPLSIGLKYYLACNEVIATWIMECCESEDWEEADKLKLIDWAARELVPMAPTHLPRPGLYNGDSFGVRTLIFNCLSYAVNKATPSNLTEYILLLAEALGISEDDFKDLGIELAESVMIDE